MTAEQNAHATLEARGYIVVRDLAGLDIAPGIHEISIDEEFLITVPAVLTAETNYADYAAQWMLSWVAERAPLPPHEPKARYWRAIAE